MTREEASYILRRFYADGYRSNNYNTIEQALQLAVMCLENFPHWISVKDAMPPRDEHYLSDSVPVLVYNPTQKYKVYIDWYIYDRCEDDDYIGWYSGNDGVTHWMLLPPEHFADVSKMMPKGGEQ